jgi:hypothetical protein
VSSFKPSPDFSQRIGKGGALQTPEKLVQAVILSSSEGSGFEFSSDYRFFVAGWLLRMTVPMGFFAAGKGPPFR